MKSRVVFFFIQKKSRSEYYAQEKKDDDNKKHLFLCISIFDLTRTTATTRCWFIVLRDFNRFGKV